MSNTGTGNIKPIVPACNNCDIWKELKHYKDLEEQGRLVEVIRCKDCKFFHHGWRCAINSCNTYADGYCYRASAKLAELKGE